MCFFVHNKPSIFGDPHDYGKLQINPPWNFLYVLGGVNPQNSYQNVETQIVPKIALLRAAIL